MQDESRQNTAKTQHERPFRGGSIQANGAVHKVIKADYF